MGQQDIGELLRRRGLLIDAIGPSRLGVDVADLLERVPVRVVRRAAVSVNDGYYASNSPTGLVRLRDHLHENAFWNKHLYSLAARRLTTILCLLVALAGAVTLFALPLAPRDEALIFARILVTVMTFGAILTQFNEILAWRSAAQAIERLEHRFYIVEGLDEDSLHKNGMADILTFFAEYTAATSRIPPFPRRVYRLHRDRLNDLWAHKNASGSSTASIAVV
ncbi:hypothetical protein [Dactylosporangium sp. NPDC051484]|uniref:hypothetical protein n=1 Tax=Dactylosporangium sp. NPDC051484 TaxID=3154942 RepID=UPI00344ED6EB